MMPLKRVHFLAFSIFAILLFNSSHSYPSQKTANKNFYDPSFFDINEPQNKRIDQGEIIYQVFLDRFFNGNRENDVFMNDPEGLFSRDRKNMKARFGGDIDGLIKKLDYIRDLGATAVWITPVIENDNSVKWENGEPVTSYHGYHGKDWYRVDRHLADIDERGLDALKRLVNEAGKRGLKIILDTVINHSSEYERSRGPIVRDGVYVTDVDEDLKKPMGTGWYNHRGIITDWDNYDGKLLDCVTENGYEGAFDFYGYVERLADLSDFNISGNMDVHNYMLHAHFAYLDTGIYGFRMDTVKHVHPNTLAGFEHFLRGMRSDFVMIGEWFGGGPLNEASLETFYYKTGQTMFDFNLRDTIQNIFSGRSERPGDLLKDTEKGYENMIEDGFDPNVLVNFVDNHDLPRFLNAVGKKGDVEASVPKLLAATAMMMAMPGIPSIYYGTEHAVHDPEFREGFFGIGGDPYNRTMMFDEDGKLIQKNRDLHKRVKRLIDLRKEEPVLSGGDFKVIKAYTVRCYDRDGAQLGFEKVFAFKRECEDRIAVFTANVSRGYCDIELNPKELGARSKSPKRVENSVSASVGKRAVSDLLLRRNNRHAFNLGPYDWVIEIFEK